MKKVTVTPDGVRQWQEPQRIVWLLIRLDVEAEPVPVSVTMPVPIMEGYTLDEMRAAYAHSEPMIEERLHALHGEDWLGHRQWSIVNDMVITESQARALFPTDAFTAGTAFHSSLDDQFRGRQQKRSPSVDPD